MLKDEIDEAKRTVSTDSVQITIGEVANMYTFAELNIIPDFQRLFRWSDDRKSNFVESILIGIPIPPAFAYERENGAWELIDGLQRISTVLEFMGILKDPDSGELRRSKLLRTKYLPSLEGYDLFQRLNRGGAYANEQEVRTCSMVLANTDFTNRLRDFVTRQDFKEIFQVTEEQRRSQKDLEYAVRLVVHSFKEFQRGKDVQEFLDKAILEVMGERDVNAVLGMVSWAVEILYRLFGDKALIPPEERLEKIAPRFSLRALEGIAVGLARNKDAILANENPDQFVQEKVGKFWMQPQVAEMSAPGLRGTVSLQRSVAFGSQWFKPNA
jgi:hypothetical protein